VIDHQPDAVVVVGDVNSTIACALTAVKLGVSVAHVEAGLRSFDRTMPEEINRVLTDAISQWLLVSEPSGVENLRREGIPEDRIHFVGNVMIDTLIACRHKFREAKLTDVNVPAGDYAVMTLHRPANVDDPAKLQVLLQAIEQIQSRIPIVFPVHPRTRKSLAECEVALPNLILCPPLGYLDFMKLVEGARLVLTDSGGIQEETTYLGIPCLTLRRNTERPSTVEQGTNLLVGDDPEHIVRAAAQVLSQPPKERRIPDLWDGHAARRILDALTESSARANLAAA
jgi:UDP-N-acetylglucosamine 2-epimerase (non-hydrolysing)